MNAPAGPAVPTFSIVLESENLRGTDAAELFTCLDSLEAQTLHPSKAVEVFLTNSAVVPPDVAADVSRRYPWVRIVNLPDGVDYYDGKLRGAELASGDVVVFCDGDCHYVTTWLEELLAPFARDPGVAIVAGDTSTPADDAVALGLSTTYIFPPFSAARGLVDVPTYESNNVAFRRALLLSHPSPSGVVLFRGNGYLHASSLRHDGHTIWLNPKARGHHPLPAGWNLVLRYLRLGQEAFVLAKLVPCWIHERRLELRRHWIRDLGLCAAIGAGRAWRTVTRFTTLVSRQPRRAAQLPVALPLAAGSLALFLIGVGISYVAPEWLTHVDRKGGPRTG